jgi:hypothetical protein
MMVLLMPMAVSIVVSRRLEYILFTILTESRQLGHALNKILKDIINRFHLMQGYRVQFVHIFNFFNTEMQYACR